MDPQTVEIIKEFFDFLKSSLTIIGTPLVTGYVGYKVAKLQYKSKLDEVSQNHEFQAKQQLFNLFKDRQREYSEEKSKIEYSLGQVVGVVRAADISDAEKSIVDPYLRLIPLHVKKAEISNASLIEEYHSKNLGTCRALSLIESNEKLLAEVKDSHDPIDDIYALLEVYTNLGVSNQYLLEHEMSEVFSTYIKNDEPWWKFW